jgi:hypothetical protein
MLSPEKIVPLQEIGVAKEKVLQYVRRFWPTMLPYKAKLDSVLFEAGDEIPFYVFYICPICTKEFIYIQNNAAFGSCEFSCDHFPPKNVKGSTQALVCKKCNNKAGHEFDYVTKDFLLERAMGMRIPGTVVATKVQIKDVKGWYHSEMTVNEKGDIEFSFLPDKNKKAVPLQEFLQTRLHTNDWTADITIPRTNTIKAEKAFIKSAYLTCFDHFGYEFIYTETALHLRNAMEGKETYPYKNIPAFLFDKPEQVQLIPGTICRITNPEDWNVFAVNIPMADENYSCLATVLIPGPNDWNHLSTLNELIDTKIDRQISFTSIDPVVPR